MGFTRKIAMMLSFCALAACAESPDDCMPHSSSGSVLDVLLVAAALTCLAVVAASSDSEEHTSKTADTTAEPAATQSLAVAPTEEGPTDPGAQYALALQSSEPAVSSYWLCRSASQEHKLQSGALYQLGDLYQRRYADPVESYKWFLLAQQHGNAIAVRRMEALRGSMAAEQVQAADKRAADWQPGDCREPPQATDRPMVRMTPT
jgi:hypothetical protein